MFWRLLFCLLCLLNLPAYAEEGTPTSSPQNTAVESKESATETAKSPDKTPDNQEQIKSTQAQDRLAPQTTQGIKKNVLDYINRYQKEIRKDLKTHAGTVNGLQAGQDQLLEQIRANASGIGALKTLVENNAVHTYESLLRSEENNDKIVELKAILEVLYDKLSRVKLKPAYQSTSTAPIATAPSLAGSVGSSDTLMLACLLVLLAPLGFTLIEIAHLEKWAVPFAGMRNLMVWMVLFLAYFTVGYSVMVSATQGGFIGSSIVLPSGSGVNEPDALLLFQLSLMVVVGMIVTTVLSDRLSLAAHALIALVLSTLVFPVVGHWAWSNQVLPDNKAWLVIMGFKDYAGATIVHSTAAWFALVWVWYFRETRTFEERERHSQQLYMHNLIYALSGIFIVWLSACGWSMGQPGTLDSTTAYIVKTGLAGASGGLIAFIYGLTVGTRKRIYNDVYIKTLGGILGGLVAIAAAVNSVTLLDAILIGVVAGIVHPLAYRWLNGAIIKNDNAAANLLAAHGFCGVWGTLAVALFGGVGGLTQPDLHQLLVQGEGVIAVFLFTTTVAFVVLQGYLALLKLSKLIASRQPAPKFEPVVQPAEATQPKRARNLIGQIRRGATSALASARGR